MIFLELWEAVSKYLRIPETDNKAKECGKLKKERPLPMLSKKKIIYYF